MVDRILIAFDGTEQAEEALTFAVGEWPDAEFTLVYAIDPSEGGYSPAAGIPSGAEDWYERTREDAETVLSEGAGLVDRPVTTDTVVGRPAESVTEYADDEGFDLVVVGSHGRSGLSRIVLGSVAEAVVRHSPVPVTVVR